MRPSAAALRSVASLFLWIAERLGRGAGGSRALEPLRDAPGEDRLLDLRHRLLSRYY